MTEGLSTNDLAVLALIAERPSHGWALAAKLARGAEIGSIWAISRPVVYHSLDRLEYAGAITAIGLERGGRGPHRVVYATTDDGRTESLAWLLQPVEHVRDVRSLFLLKLVLVERAGLEVEQLLVAQRAVLLPLIGMYEAQLDEADAEAAGEETVAVFHLETTGALVRFIDSRLDRVAARAGSAGAGGSTGYDVFRQLGIGSSVGVRNTVTTAPPET